MGQARGGGPNYDGAVLCANIDPNSVPGLGEAAAKAGLHVAVMDDANAPGPVSVILWEARAAQHDIDAAEATRACRRSYRW